MSHSQITIDSSLPKKKKKLQILYHETLPTIPECFQTTWIGWKLKIINHSIFNLLQNINHCTSNNNLYTQFIFIIIRNSPIHILLIEEI